MGLRNTSGNTERSTYREPCKDKVRSGLRAARAQAAGSDPLRAGGIVCPSAGGRLGRPSGRCVRMGSRVVESAATEDARPDAGSQDNSGSEVDTWGSSDDDEGLELGGQADPLRDKPRTVHGKAPSGHLG